MSISIYKPNSKNAGAGFSFQMGIDSKSKEPERQSLYIKNFEKPNSVSELVFGGKTLISATAKAG